MSHTDLKILSLNVWGVPYVTDKRRRIRALCAALAHTDYDIICLQEVWDRKDLRAIITGAAAGGLTYHHYFASQGYGSGLIVLSRYPIMKTAFHRFELDGSLGGTWRLHHYLASKGIGFARVQTPGGELDVYNLHFVMQIEPPDLHGPHRAAQAHALVQFIGVHTSENPVLVCGDFNMHPHQLPYDIVVTAATLRDAYVEVNGAGDPTYIPENPYVKSPPQRLDYVFVRDGAERRINTQQAVLDFKFIEDTNRRMAYSDHFGVGLSLSLQDIITDERPAVDVERLQDATRKIQDELERGIITAQRQRNRLYLQARFVTLALPLIWWLLPRRYRPWAVVLLPLLAFVRARLIGGYLKAEIHELEQAITALRHMEHKETVSM